jgi:hypothetical protein
MSGKCFNTASSLHAILTCLAILPWQVRKWLDPLHWCLLWKRRSRHVQELQSQVEGQLPPSSSIWLLLFSSTAVAYWGKISKIACSSVSMYDSTQSDLQPESGAPESVSNCPRFGSLSPVPSCFRTQALPMFCICSFSILYNYFSNNFSASETK